MEDEVKKLYARYEPRGFARDSVYKERLAVIYECEAVKLRSRRERRD